MRKMNFNYHPAESDVDALKSQIRKLRDAIESATGSKCKSVIVPGNIHGAWDLGEFVDDIEVAIGGSGDTIVMHTGHRG